MGTFRLDITKGKSKAQLRADYIRTSRIAGEWQTIALWLVDAGANVEALPEPYRTKVKKLIESYSD